MIAALHQHSTKLQTNVLLFAAVIMVAFVGASTYAGLFWLPLLVSVVVLIAPIFVLRPEIWLYAVACVLPVFVVNSDEGVSTVDVLYAVFLLGSLGVWLVRRILWDPRPFITNWLDAILLLYFAYTSTNIVSAMAHGTEPLNWFRQFTLGSMVLYYFPLREHIRGWKEVRILSVILSLVMVGLTLKSLNDFRTVVRTSEYAYQIAGRRLVPQAYLMACIASLVYLSFKPIHWRRLGALAVSILVLLGLISTYARTTWIAFILCMSLSFFFLQAQQRRRIAKVVFLFATVVVVGGTMFFGRTSQIIATVISNRFLSASNFKKDQALGNRAYESRGVAKLVEQNPIAGYGLGTPYQVYDAYLVASSRGSYIHNGLLSPLYFFGIVGAILQYLVLFVALGRGVLVTLRCKQPRARMLALICMLTILGISLENLTASAFYFRSVVFVLAYSFAGLCIAERFEREERPWVVS